MWRGFISVGWLAGVSLVDVTFAENESKLYKIRPNLIMSLDKKKKKVGSKAAILSIFSNHSVSCSEADLRVKLLNLDAFFRNRLGKGSF